MYKTHIARGDGAVTNIGSVDYAVVPAATHVNLVQGNIQMTNSATDFFLDDGAVQHHFCYF